MEACSHFQQRSYAAFYLDVANRRRGYARENLEQCRLTSTVLAYNAHYVSLLNLEADVTQSPHKTAVAFLGAVIGVTYLQERVFLTANSSPPAVKVLAQCARADGAEDILFSYIIEFYDSIVHCSLEILDDIHKVALYTIEYDYTQQ